MTILGSTSRLDGCMGLSFGVGKQDFMITGGPKAIAAVAALIAENAYELRYRDVPCGGLRDGDVATVDVGQGFVTGPWVAIDAIRGLIVDGRARTR